MSRTIVTEKYGVTCEVQIKKIDGVEVICITPHPKGWKNPQSIIAGWV